MGQHREHLRSTRKQHRSERLVLAARALARQQSITPRVALSDEVVRSSRTQSIHGDRRLRSAQKPGWMGTGS